MKVTKDFVFFWKTEEVFSQWHPSTFIVDGIIFKTAEQYMMYHKAIFFGDTESAKKVLETTDPREQKKIGRAVKNFDAVRWAAVAKDVVYAGNKAKFTQNADMLKQLLRNSGKEYVEASPYDNIWGIGIGENDSRIYDKSQWQGTNWLGEILTKLRNELFTGPWRSPSYSEEAQKEIVEITIQKLEEQNKKYKDVLTKWCTLCEEADMRPEDECSELYHLSKETLRGDI